jgi:hypothetical protein
VHGAPIGGVVRADAAALEQLEATLRTYSADMSHDFGLQKARVENELLQVKQPACLPAMPAINSGVPM